MKRFSATNPASIRGLLFQRGLSKTLEYFCTFSVFSFK